MDVVAHDTIQEPPTRLPELTNTMAPPPESVAQLAAAYVALLRVSGLDRRQAWMNGMMLTSNN